MSSNRNPISQWEVTFPRIVDYNSCSVEILKKFLEQFPPCKWGAVVCEQHNEPGTPDGHYHMILILKKPISFAKMLNWIKSVYPDDWKRAHISPVRSIKDFYDYIKKESRTFYEVGEMPKQGKSEKIDYRLTLFEKYHNTMDNQKIYFRYVYSLDDDWMEKYKEWVVNKEQDLIKSELRVLGK